MSNEQTVPGMDHGVSETAQSEQSLLDAVMRGSDFFQEAAGPVDPLPMNEGLVPDTDESYQEDQDQYDESADYEETEEAEVEYEDEGDEESNPVPDVYTSDDLDLDARVRVKVDGEEMDVSFADLLKGYQLDASLSKKGRDLGDARKALDEEKAQALQEVQALSKASSAVLLGQEQYLAAEFHKIEAAIDKARDEGDTFELSELKDKREAVQKNYWKAHNEREAFQGQLKAKEEEQTQRDWEAQMTHFNENIEGLVPGFNPEMAGAIRDFAVSEGLPETLVDTITDPLIVRMLNDYRIIKTGVNKGSAKRKAAPTNKALPTKKGKAPNQKEADRIKMVKARAFREDSSTDDQMDFLKQYAAQSLGNI